MHSPSTRTRGNRRENKRKIKVKKIGGKRTEEWLLRYAKKEREGWKTPESVETVTMCKVNAELESMKPCMNEAGMEEVIGGEGALYERGLDTQKGSQARKRGRGHRDFQTEKCNARGHGAAQNAGWTGLSRGAE